MAIVHSTSTVTESSIEGWRHRVEPVNDVLHGTVTGHFVWRNGFVNILGDSVPGSKTFMNGMVMRCSSMPGFDYTGKEEWIYNSSTRLFHLSTDDTVTMNPDEIQSIPVYDFLEWADYDYDPNDVPAYYNNFTVYPNDGSIARSTNLNGQTMLRYITGSRNGDIYFDYIAYNSCDAASGQIYLVNTGYNPWLVIKIGAGANQLQFNLLKDYLAGYHTGNSDLTWNNGIANNSTYANRSILYPYDLMMGVSGSPQNAIDKLLKLSTASGGVRLKLSHDSSGKILKLSLHVISRHPSIPDLTQTEWTEGLEFIVATVNGVVYMPIGSSRNTTMRAQSLGYRQGSVSTRDYEYTNINTEFNLAARTQTGSNPELHDVAGYLRWRGMDVSDTGINIRDMIVRGCNGRYFSPYSKVSPYDNTWSWSASGPVRIWCDTGNIKLKNMLNGYCDKIPQMPDVRFVGQAVDMTMPTDSRLYTWSDMARRAGYTRARVRYENMYSNVLGYAPMTLTSASVHLDFPNLGDTPLSNLYGFWEFDDGSGDYPYRITVPMNVNYSPTRLPVFIRLIDNRPRGSSDDLNMLRYRFNIIAIVNGVSHSLPTVYLYLSQFDRDESCQYPYKNVSLDYSYVAAGCTLYITGESSVLEDTSGTGLIYRMPYQDVTVPASPVERSTVADFYTYS